ncbi:hypothetical protein JTE90_000112 [Oedothorax gibbosus]|uniref:Uncharacterized protein n=1 Tax=Oedothorax gibbosus TaxID=931172 RepID=A0AAV6V018_9ARAC|nr:hypothetical protein JTE90_000112 [Oedothorax gibbosus]
MYSTALNVGMQRFEGWQALCFVIHREFGSGGEGMGTIGKSFGIKDPPHPGKHLFPFLHAAFVGVNIREPLYQEINISRRIEFLADCWVNGMDKS